MIISELQLDVKKVYPDLENLEVTPTTNQQIFNHQNSYGYDNVVVNAVDNTIDENITPNNIRTGVRILGVDGNLEPDKPNQEKEVTPTRQEQNIFADTGYELGKVVVKPIPSEYIVPIGSVDIVENGVYDVTSVAEATVNTPVPFGTKEITENGNYNVYDYANAIVNIEGTKLNIDYSLETPPTDTSKLWVKSEKPTKVIFDSNVSGSNSIETLSTRLNTGVKFSVCGVIGKKIYLFGGNTNIIQVYDTTNNTVNTLSTTLPTKTSYSACGVKGTKCYLFGGYNGSDRIDRIDVFDTETETIETLSATTSQFYYGKSCAVVGNNIYILGGSSGGGSSTNTIEIFDTLSNTIKTSTATLNTRVGFAGCGVVGTKIYLFGGTGGNSNTNTIQVFDTETQTTKTLSTTLPAKVSSLVCGVIGTKCYLFGGATNQIMVFDTETQTITTLSTTLPSPTSYTTCGVIGQNIYLLGGINFEYAIQKFSPLFDLNNGILLIIPSTTDQLPIMKDENIELNLGVLGCYLGNVDNVGEQKQILQYDNELNDWVVVA